MTRRVGALAAAALALTLAGCKHARRPDTPAVRIIVSDTGGAMPDTLPVGIAHLRLVNRGLGERQLAIVRMTGDVGTADRYLERRLAGERWPDFAADAGGTARVAGGDSSDVWLRLPPGRYVAHIGALGAIAPDLVKDIRVRSATHAASDTLPPETDDELELRDDGFRWATAPGAGTHHVRVSNRGSEPHEARLYRMPEGGTLDDLMAWVRAGERGPAPWPIAGGVSALFPGGEAWMRVTLEPGSYVMLCTAPPRKPDDGTPRHASGVAMRFEVP